MIELMAETPAMFPSSGTTDEYNFYIEKTNIYITDHIMHHKYCNEENWYNGEIDNWFD
jgi:hypothetical protein